jgi:hypothetical protein
MVDLAASAKKKPKLFSLLCESQRNIKKELQGKGCCLDHAKECGGPKRVSVITSDYTPRQNFQIPPQYNSYTFWMTIDAEILLLKAVILGIAMHCIPL